MRTIRELRRERGWTQYELAQRVGVHPQAVYLWESGRRTPLVAQMRRLGRAFGMCSDEIALLGAERHEAGAGIDAAGAALPIDAASAGDVQPSVATFQDPDAEVDARYHPKERP